MSSSTQNTKVGIEQGGERLFVKAGGEIDIEAGGKLKFAGVEFNPGEGGGGGDTADDSFAATFDQAVGEKTILVRKRGNLVTLDIPAGSTADGGNAVIASGATDVPEDFRPADDVSFPAIVTDNQSKTVGKVTIKATGQIVFCAGAADDDAFTDDKDAGFDHIAVTYALPEPA